MCRLERDAGFTLVEVLVVVGMIVVIVATLGAFFLAGPSPAVASAARDIRAAFDEARETAVAFSESTVVFSPAGGGYSARVYREMPGDAAFEAVNGPTYDSTVAITETAAPLGTPGFAFRVDSRGTVTGYQNFALDATTYAMRSCPASGAFVLALAYGNQRQSVSIPCTLPTSALAMTAPITPPPIATPAAAMPGTCPPTQSCVTALSGITATCPPGYTADGTQSNVCDQVITATPTAPPQLQPAACPSGYTGSPPNCSFSSQTASPAVVPIQKYTIYAGVFECSTSDPSCNDGAQYWSINPVIVLLSNGDVFANLTDVSQPSFTSFDRSLVNCIQSGSSVVYTSPDQPFRGSWNSAIIQSGYETQFDAGPAESVPVAPLCDPTLKNCTGYTSYDSYWMGSSSFDFIAWINAQINASTGYTVQGYEVRDCQ